MGAEHVIKRAHVVSVDKTIGNVANCDALIEVGIVSAVGSNLQHAPECTVIEGTKRHFIRLIPGRLSRELLPPTSFRPTTSYP